MSCHVQPTSSSNMNVNTTLISILIGFLDKIALEHEISLKLMEITQFINEENYYHTLIYMENDGHNDDGYNSDKIIRNLIETNSKCLINLKGNTSFNLFNTFNRKYLAIVQLEGSEENDQEMLENLWKTLRRNRLTRLLLFASRTTEEEYIGNILKYCRDNKALNVVLIKADFKDSNEFYRSQIYPKFSVISKNIKIKDKTLFYPDHVKNMHGFSLRLVMNKESAKCYVLRQENGTNFQLGGYAGHFFMEFGRKHNASLTFPNYDNFKAGISIEELDKLLDNGTYDASAEPTYSIFDSSVVYSHTYDYTDWCLMMPLEKPLPAHMFYVIIYDKVSLCFMLIVFILFSLVLALALKVRGQPVGMPECIVNIYVLNGLLGQPFRMESTFAGLRSFIYLLICVGGLIFNTTYVTHLQTFNACPPLESSVQTIDDILGAGLKIAMLKSEYFLIKTFGFEDLLEISGYELLSSYEEFNRLRDNFDSRYVYPVPSARWSFYEQQQEIFLKPRFRLSNICIVKGFGLMVALQENSPYESAVNTLLGQAIQAGLISHWKSMAFWEALEMNLIRLEDLSSRTTFEPMKLEDLQLLLRYFIYPLVLACGCCLMEIVWPQRVVFSQFMWRKLKLCYDILGRIHILLRRYAAIEI